jgi:hypothetical protein
MHSSTSAADYSHGRQQRITMDRLLGGKRMEENGECKLIT